MVNSSDGVLIRDTSSIWRAKDGTIPVLDDPTLVLTAHYWERPPILDLNVTLRRMQRGEIGSPDLHLSELLMDWYCLTEKQIRKLSLSVFDKEHKTATRLRMLQKIGWFDGFWIEREGYKENVWIQGIASQQYFSFVAGVNVESNPMDMLNHRQYSLSICAINDFRIIIEDRGNVPKLVKYAPLWKKNCVFNPFCQMVVSTKKGSLTLYIERIIQSWHPLSIMRNKLAMYEKMTADNQGQLPPLEKGAALIVWSVGSIEAIKALVSSIDYLPDLPMVFLVDELLQDFPHSFFIAKKGRTLGEVDLQAFSMDLL